ncbi:choline/carnitine O-acyltransferase [Suttonella ornithocola]|uniref:Choline/Carnitine o-acyltransferase n=1 Tax=Suttonella ornithocola TaxID=279832 RepID=A0A380MSQ0_9GAMM|nr:choline/carnitine O-acyltransferase [Suttonella ornithocola]SUO95649.1 Choline/Carnitine o-acyltransferase [Suttonella ornithocola]
MKTLPLPTLSSAIERLTYWISPLLEESVLEKTTQAVERFTKQDGEALYHALEVQAAAKAPDSWLIDIWRRQFLTERDSLPLTNSNATMQIDWHAPQQGLKRVAHFIIAMAHVHRQYEQDAIASQAFLDQKGQALCLAQWEVLRGADRRPASHKDELQIQENEGKQKRHIIVLYRGYAWKVSLMDEKGNIANPAQLENVLYELVQVTTTNNDIPFTAPSILDNETALEVRAQLVSRDENSRIIQLVKSAWFIVSINTHHYSDTAETFFDAAFGQGNNFWAYKPINYCCYVKDNRIFVHFDRSHIDPAALEDMIALGQTQFNQKPFKRKNQLPEDLSMSAINWTIDGQKNNGNTREFIGTFKTIYDGLGEYQRRTQAFMVTLYDVFMTDEEQRLLRDYNNAGIIQILLQYAQLNVYGEVRNTSEMIDMRHFLNGRIDIIPTVTKDSLECVQAIFDNENTIDLLRNAVNAYNKRYALAKNGGGIYGFWFAMQYMAEVQGLEVPLFQDKGILSLTRPFITTIGCGENPIGGHIVFPPADPDGLTISYRSGRNYCNFVLTHRRSKINEVEKFTRAIGSGLKQILLMLREMA